MDKELCHRAGMEKVIDVRIEQVRPLLSPDVVLEELPLGPSLPYFIAESRQTATNIIRHLDDRLICIVGPCSIHDPAAALEYAARLRKLAQEVKNDVFIIMRCAVWWSCFLVWCFPLQ